MRKKYTEEQSVGILRGAEASGKGVKEYCRENGVHETTFYAWKKRSSAKLLEQEPVFLILPRRQGDIAF